MFIFFFFKQKTAYEMRISDWSSDVCSSDLPLIPRHIASRLVMQVRASGTPLIPTRKIVDFLGIRAMEGGDGGLSTSLAASSYRSQEIGRASCRERVCQYV